MQVCNNLATDETDDHKKVWLQVHKWTTKSRKNSTLGVASAWWNRARHQWQRDHQDPEHLPHTAHEHQHVNGSAIPCAHSPVVRFLSSYCTPHRGSSFTFARHLMVITWWAYLFDLESSIPFYFFKFSFILNLLHFLLHIFHYFEGSSDTAYFAKKEMDSLDDSYLLTSSTINLSVCSVNKTGWLFINRSHRSWFHKFIRFPLLRRPILVSIPLWVTWWVRV